MRLLICLLPLVGLLAMPTAGPAMADRATFATACAPRPTAQRATPPSGPRVVVATSAPVVLRPFDQRATPLYASPPHAVPALDRPLLLGALLMLGGALMWRWGDRHGG